MIQVNQDRQRLQPFLRTEQRIHAQDGLEGDRHFCTRKHSQGHQAAGGVRRTRVDVVGEVEGCAHEGELILVHDADDVELAHHAPEHLHAWTKACAEVKRPASTDDIGTVSANVFCEARDTYQESTTQRVKAVDEVDFPTMLKLLAYTFIFTTSNTSS